MKGGANALTTAGPIPGVAASRLGPRVGHRSVSAAFGLGSLHRCGALPRQRAKRASLNGCPANGCVTFARSLAASLRWCRREAQGGQGCLLALALAPTMQMNRPPASF